MKKISVAQVIGSAIAAVTSAILLSFLGEAGTIIGVALGSIIATVGGAAIAESLRRGHSAVKSVAGQKQWHVPGTGAVDPGQVTRPVGAVESTAAPSPTAPTGDGTAVTQRPGSPGRASDPTIRPLASSRGTTRPLPGEGCVGPPGDAGRAGSDPRAGNAARPGGPAATMRGPGAAPPRGTGGAGSRRPLGAGGSDRLVFGLRWPVLAGLVVVVLAITIGTVLIIEAILGQSIAKSVRGGPSPAPTTTVPAPTSTTSTTRPPQRTTTTTAPSRTTTTTTPQTTTTTGPSTTTTTSPGSSTTVGSGTNSGGSGSGSGSADAGSGST